MRRFLLISSLLATPAWAQDAQGDLAVTIYNDNLALVQDTRQLAIPAGRSRQEFPDVSGQISPETGEQGGDRQAQPASRAGHDNGFSREQPINIDRWMIAQSFTGKPVTGFRH